MNKQESLERRREAVLEEAEDRGFEAVVLVNEIVNLNPSNFVYLMPDGLGEEHQTLVMDVNGGLSLVTPHWGATRYEETGEYDTVIAIKQEKGHQIHGTKIALEGYDMDKICFALSTMSTNFAFKLQEGLGIDLTPERDISESIFKLRAIKDRYEIEEMRRAIEITERAFIKLIQETEPGLDTHDMKKRLDGDLIQMGAWGFSFDSSIRFIRGGGDDRILRHGDALSLDVGVRVESGYCSDMGRNWPVTLEQDTKDYMERAAKAQVEGIKNIREGVTGNRVLELANEINEELGFEPTVRTGHQVGLDVHDYTMPHAPSFGPIETDSQPLKAGMTLTYEPQRRDEKNGLRGHIEDIVLVTEGDPVVLNRMPYLWHR